MKRQRLQFSLRNFLLVFAIAGLCLGWIGQHVIQYLEKRDSEEAHEALRRRNGEDPGVRLAWWTGGGIVLHYWDESHATDDDLTEDLILIERSDSQLGRLDVENVEITDDGLKQLVRFRQSLGGLALNGIPVGNRTMSRLRELPGLWWLELANLEEVTDGGLAHLSMLPRLSDLRISCMPISDVGLEHLTEISSLRSLYLERIPITDAGLEVLTAMPDLEVLWLEDLRITDAGLEYVRTLKNLKELQIHGTDCSEAAGRSLIRDLPNCDIYSDLIIEER